MVFSSYLFIFFFLPLALLSYYLAPRRARHLVLTISSYVFYGWANPAFTVLMMLSTAIDYVAGLKIAGAPIFPRGGAGGEIAPLPSGGPRSRQQKIFLAVSMTANLALLGFFKYFHFAVDSWNGLAHFVGLDAALVHTTLKVVLPLGISFYTFQSMSYAIDVYRGETAALRNPIDFACFVAMFPQLVAGPIIRFSEVADQLRERSHTIAKFARGVVFFSFGLAKKVLIANSCGRLADIAFGAHELAAFDAWLGIVAYAFQIYFDFSGYSDMAIGLGLMFGFSFPKNFDSPYLSRSITEFWRRWHMSLSRWLRDYLYLSLGGNRKGRGRTYVNLALVMLLGGLWHGASWNFVIWGAFHGAWLIFERWRGERAAARGEARARPVGLAAVPSVAFTFVLVLISWVFFRAADLGHAGRYLESMFLLGESSARAALVSGVLVRPYTFLALAIGAIVVWLAPQSWDFTRHLPWWKALWALALLILSLVVLGTQGFNPFIYFIF
jgi:alginate O-acetyltransferase complex protein AlgI